MSVATYDALYDLRGQLEKNILSAIAGDLATFDRLNSGVFQKNRARFECLVKVGAPNGHKKILSLTDRRYDQFHFQLSVTVITASASALVRNAGETNADFLAREEAQNGLHTQLVAHFDAFMSQLQLASIADVGTFPTLTLLWLQGGGHEPALHPEEGTEGTKLNYAGQFGIRNEAWGV